MPTSSSSMIRSCFLALYKDLEAYRAGKPICLDGKSLSIAAMVAVSRYAVDPQLDESVEARDRVRSSRAPIEEAIQANQSIYGVTTGVGGSAGSKSTDVLTLGVAILQQIQCGILAPEPSDGILPINHPQAATVMPESWVRGALLTHINNLARGYSGIRWDVIEAMYQILKANIIPLVPLRGSVSASGDLTPLSFLAGTIVGNPYIRVYTGPPGARIVSNAQEALAQAGITPMVFQAKEPLSMVNGTSYSASTAAIICYEAVQLSLLSLVCTALAVEGLNGYKGSFAPFIHDVARPHPGQIEVAEGIRYLLEPSELAQDRNSVTEDRGQLLQDRYALRTSPQYLGPQFEDIYSATKSVEIECNSCTLPFSLEDLCADLEYTATDNPLIEAATGTIHMGGNFQAMSITNAMEKTRLALFHIGKNLFAQSTELNNPQMSNGLPPSTAATNPSLDYHTKGLDVTMASYVAELGFLANPVGTHNQSVEMHNQGIK
ncbi:hypothetical protein HGRIS_005235 [Hohenbuehelia grisea]|uniref:Phenylalanine ammonia-lyase n=1 Tax=Hohenbuehelia grisea TaxID=104357 RepID=A0ABR3JEG4_9AGAR